MICNWLHRQCQVRAPKVFVNRPDTLSQVVPQRVKLSGDSGDNAERGRISEFQISRMCVQQRNRRNACEQVASGGKQSEIRKSVPGPPAGTSGDAFRNFRFRACVCHSGTGEMHVNKLPQGVSNLKFGKASQVLSSSRVLPSRNACEQVASRGKQSEIRRSVPGPSVPGPSVPSRPGRRERLSAPASSLPDVAGQRGASKSGIPALCIA
jgi:hypothetical protein